MRLLLLLAVLLAAGAAVVLRGEDDGRPRDRDRAQERRDEARDRDRDRPRRRARRPLRMARCPDGVPGCRAVRGRVVLVESVDPDGDGDLHVVLTGGSVTAPGVTAVDVRPGLRPRRDPRVGDQATAAGPVQRGSFGQDQVHALSFRLRRR